MAKILMTVHRKQTILATEIPGPDCRSPASSGTMLQYSIRCWLLDKPNEFSFIMHSGIVSVRSLEFRSPLFGQHDFFNELALVSELEAFPGGFGLRPPISLRK